MALAAGDDEVNRWPPAPDVSAANANLSIDPSGISISKYTTYFVPLKQSNRLVGIAGGKDVVASCNSSDAAKLMNASSSTTKMLPNGRSNQCSLRRRASFRSSS
jgi:hypothetical protein